MVLRARESLLLYVVLLLLSAIYVQNAQKRPRSDRSEEPSAPVAGPQSVAKTYKQYSEQDFQAACRELLVQKMPYISGCDSIWGAFQYHSWSNPTVQSA